MAYLIIGIFCNILLLIILRSFKKYDIPAFPAIVLNYFVAGSFSLLFTSPKSVYLQSTHLWVPASALGALFIFIFYLISQTTEKMGVSVASVANKMSVVIPVLLAFIIYSDSISLLKIAGILIALLSVTLVSANHEDNNQKAPLRNYLLPAAVFLGSGIIDSLVNFAQKKIVHTGIETACFSGLSFYAAGFIGLIIFLSFYKGKKQLPYSKIISAGIILGIPNYFSIYFIMKAIDSNIMQSSVLYPIVNVSVVLGSTMAALFLFSEKLSKKNTTGILLSVLAIVLIALS